MGTGKLIKCMERAFTIELMVAFTMSATDIWVKNKAKALYTLTIICLSSKAPGTSLCNTVKGKPTGMMALLSIQASLNMAWSMVKALSSIGQVFRKKARGNKEFVMAK